MTAAGKMCSPERQEFILLSDSSACRRWSNGLHDATALEQGTHTSLLAHSTARHADACGRQFDRQNPKPGSECVLYGRVTDAGDRPVANATVSIWQTGADGLYDIQASATSVDYRGVFSTEADGLYVLRTVKPLGYSIPMDGPVGAMVKAQARHGMRPAHIHFLVGAPATANWSPRSICATIPIWLMMSCSVSSDDLAVDVAASDPDCPIKGMSSIRFDMRLSRESAADRPAGASAPIRRRS